MRILCLLILIFTSFNVFARYDPCKYLYESYCSSFNSNSSRSSGASLPSMSSATSFNPSSVASVDGFGFETIEFKGDFDFSLASGNGAVGAGLATANPENTFYGNLAIEDEHNYKRRVLAFEKYDSLKYNLVAGFNPFGKKNTGIFQSSVGLIGKYNRATGRVKAGAGFSFEMGPLNAGVSYYGDDYRNNALGKSYSYNTTAFSAGLKLPFFSFDYNHIYNHPNSDVPASKIQIYNGTVFVKDYMLTYGKRFEYSFRKRYVFSDRTFVSGALKEAEFLGAQVIIKKKFVFGLFKNYYLLREWTLSFAAFF